MCTRAVTMESVVCEPCERKAHEACTSRGKRLRSHRAHLPDFGPLKYYKFHASVSRLRECSIHISDVYEERMIFSDGIDTRAMTYKCVKHSTNRRPRATMRHEAEPLLSVRLYHSMAHTGIRISNPTNPWTHLRRSHSSSTSRAALT